ncbi:hypothetical protein PHYBOEH_005571 [Phytophthora boehmeriae]|uniref:Uncharacterized protein n=1 Tax=Phytophthora boehmeriae TaxID=109152 RepID=A0A8T1WJT8_9STRA|nr:hypothetical protein PHYBOEH_005571 [Phytophthora boehmeriae]
MQRDLLAVDEKTVMTLLDVAGSCIVDIAFNHLYDRAIALHEKTNQGLAECYRQTLSNYVSESSTPRFFSMLLNSIHHYTRMCTIYHTISYLECVNLYASLFVPHMYLASLTADQKLNILSMIFGGTVKQFADAIIQQYISSIIDDHNDPVNVEELQDCVLKILLRERDVSYERFIQSQKSTKKKVTIAPTVKSGAITRLTTAFQKSVVDRAGLKKRNKVLVRKHAALATQFAELKNMFLEHLASYKEQGAIIAELKAQLAAQPPSEEVQTVKPSEDFDDAFSMQYV